MDIRKIKKLIELLEESGVSEIEIREGEESVRIARSSPAEAAPGKAQVISHSTAPSPAAPTLYRKHRTPKNPSRRGCLEFPRPRTRGARLHRRYRMAQPL